jgi:hypothetical protein
MTSKTPYELRFDLLTMAQSILTEQNMNMRIKIENDWNMACEKARILHDKGRDAEFPSFPLVPIFDEEQVIAMAEKLNSFVSKND